MKQIYYLLATSTTLVLLSATPVLAQAPSAPLLNVITPQEGQTIYGTKVPILFSVDQVQLTDPSSNPKAATGQGHMLVWLDDQNPSKDSAKVVIEDNTTYSDVPAGDHTLKVELVNNDNTSLTPTQVSTIHFKTAAVGSPEPAPSPTFDKNTALVILVVVALVIIAAWWYTKEDEEDMPKAEVSSKKPAAKKKTTKKKPAKKAKK